MNQLGKTVFSKVEKVNSELFSLTYGAIVTQLLKDFEEVDATNDQLERMCACVTDLAVHCIVHAFTNSQGSQHWDSPR